MNTTFYTLLINDISQLTRESVTLTFQLPEQLKEIFQFTQGQHLTLMATIDGKEVRRSYSICSNVKGQQLQVAIKRLAGGIFSNYANDHLKAGMTLEVMSPQGHFYTELNAKNQKHYLCIAAGSGITPIISHIQSILSIEANAKLTLIFVNKTTASMMFRDKLSFIKNAYMDRFQWINLFSNEAQQVTIYNGRITADKLTQLEQAQIIQLKTFNDVFLCGPENMINEVSEYLKTQGLNQEQIHYELFFSDSGDQQSLEKQQYRSQKFGDESSEIIVKASGIQTRFKLTMGGSNILDAALYEGADLPFSCKAGVCATCKAQLLKGSVEMDQNHALTDEEVADGMILSCQAHPTSSDVELDFDII